jgi:hypothetical protein
MQPKENPERHPSEELAEWLQEVGRRRVPGREAADVELLAHLERLSGRKINSRDDITAYVSELSQKVEAARSKWQYLKNGLLGALLIIAILQYYFIDVQLQILSQPSLTVFVRPIDLREHSRVRM